jgi:predicted O-methyltransferase YrrM
MLCRLVSARRVLEVGMLGGYSTVRLARGLSAGGRIVTLETVGDKGDVGLTIAIRS